MDVVRTEFFMAEPNYLETLFADEGNKYLYGYTNNRIYTTAGPEFGE